MAIKRKNKGAKIPLPVYNVLIEDIISRIRSKGFKPEEALPSENQLVKKYHISRGSVRTALRELQEKDLIYSLPGKGSFVKKYSSSQNISEDKIAFIVPSLEDSDLQIYQGIEETLNKEGFVLSIFNSQRSIERENKNLRLLLEGNEKGAIIFPNWGRSNIEIIFELKRANYPFVLIDRYFRDLETDYVVTDNKKGGYLATEYLIKLGHRRIGIIAGLSCTAIEDRLEGYREALAEYNILHHLSLMRKVNEVDKLEPSNGGYLETKELLKEKPTAIFATNDFFAQGAMKAIEEENLSIPEDISLIGFDNQKFSENLSPPLTTIAQPFYSIGKNAAKILIKKISGVSDRIKQITLSPELIIRSTVRPFPLSAPVYIDKL